MSRRRCSLVTIRLAVALLAGGFGCYTPAFQDCELACGVSDSCPDGQSCQSGRCRDNGLSGACTGVEIDAPMIDAPAGPRWSTPEDIGLPLGFTDPTLLGHQREMYLAKDNLIYVTTYTASPPAWSAPQSPPEVVVFGNVTAPHVSFDGLRLYLTQIVPASGGDIFVASRTMGGPFESLTPVDPLNSPNNDSGGSTSGNRLLLAFSSNRTVATHIELYASTRGTQIDAWGVPKILGELNHPTANDTHPVFEDTGRMIVFASDRTGNFNLFFATRANDTDAFGPPAEITELSTATAETDPWLAPDGRTLYFVRGIGAATRIMRSVRL